jgi:alpha-L-fucosidase
MRLIFAFLAASLVAAQPYKPSPENLKARQWFQEARFGMFIHWGVYSVLENGEWVMNQTKMSAADYDKIPPRFNPVKYDPAKWVAIAKNAGMKYITITSRHHDGFAMFDSKVTEWDIADRTPYKKDALKMLADECARQGMPLFFYYSHLDWHHPDYYPLGRTGHASNRPPGGNFSKYLDYVDAQLTELLSGRYGPIAGIWFDGWWDQQVKKLEPKNGGDPKAPIDKTQVDWRLRRTYDLIHKLRPAALIGNNHHVAPFPGEDFQMFEKDLPGRNTTGFSEDATIGTLPLETCETINKSWGYRASDKAFKSTRELIQYLAKAAGANANFLLNVGPTPLGELQPEFVERLQQIGAWMKVNGESIYGTRGGPVAPQPWGVTTQKGGTVYVHVLDSQAKSIRLSGVKAKSARLLKGGNVPFQESGELTLDLSGIAADPNDTVIAIQTR